MFNYHQPNLENMQQYLNQEKEKSGGEGPTWWSIPSGMSSVRILPPWDPTGRVALPVYMHPIEYKGEGMSFTKYNWTCVNKTFGKPCPICEGLAGLAAAGVDTSNWEANRRQFYFNAIVMHDPTFDNKGKGTAPGTHVLMKAPKTFYDWVIAQITNPMIGDITSVTNGIDVYITKEGSGLGTSYNMTLSPNGRTEIPKEYLDKITDLYNLDDIFSAGFDQKQIDELVTHLKKSAGVMANSIPSTMNQMAGYQSQMNYSMPNPQPAVVPNQFAQSSPMIPNQFSAPPTGMPVVPNQFAQSSPTTPPWEQPQGTINLAPAQAPAAPQAPIQDNLPKCFGNYDSGSVNCVVCPHEINCSQKK
jgi:hypothetical protein